MGYTNSLPIASAYCTLGHQPATVDPVRVIKTPGGDIVTFSFEADGADARFPRQKILEACTAKPDGVDAFDDLISYYHPDLLDAWHAALAAAAHRGAQHAEALVRLTQICPPLYATQIGGGDIVIVTDSTTDEQVRELAKL